MYFAFIIAVYFDVKPLGNKVQVSIMQQVIQKI